MFSKSNSIRLFGSIIVAIVLVSSLFIELNIQFQARATDTLTLYANTFDGTASWYTVGSSPWLDDSSGYIYTRTLREHKWSGFEDANILGQITSVLLLLESKSASPAMLEITIRTTSIPEQVADTILLLPEYTWGTVNITEIVNCWQDVNNLEISIELVGSIGWTHVRRARIDVIYDPGPPPPPPPQGTLTIESTPIVGECYANGSYWGYTPQTRSVPVGNYIVSWGYVSGYTRPPSQTIGVEENDTVIVIGVYNETAEPPPSISEQKIGHTYDYLMFTNSTATYMVDSLEQILWSSTASNVFNAVSGNMTAGGVLYLLDGNYTLDRVVGPRHQNQTWIGESWNTVLFMREGGSDTIINVNEEGSFFTLRNVQLHGNKIRQTARSYDSDKTTNAIHVTGGDYCLFDRLYIHDTLMHAVIFDGSATHNTLTNSLIDNNGMDNPYYWSQSGVLLIGEGTSYNEIVYNTISNNYNRGIYLSWGIHHNLIAHNNIVNNRQGQILGVPKNMMFNTLAFNRIGGGWTGISLTGTPGYENYGNQFIGNIIDNTYFGLGLSYFDHTSIVDNIIQVHREGIVLEDSDYCRVHDNDVNVTEMGFNAFSESGSSDYNSVRDNTVNATIVLVGVNSVKEDNIGEPV